MNSVRINYNKCSEQSFAAFIKNINKLSDFVFKNHNPADDNVLQDRYTFSKNKSRISIVYETKAQTLIITAPQDVIADVKSQVPAELSAVRQEKSNDDKTAAAKKDEFKGNTGPLNVVKDKNNLSARAGKNNRSEIKNKNAESASDVKSVSDNANVNAKNKKSMQAEKTVLPARSSAVNDGSQKSKQPQDAAKHAQKGKSASAQIDAPTSQKKAENASKNASDTKQAKAQGSDKSTGQKPVKSAQKPVAKLNIKGEAGDKDKTKKAQSVPIGDNNEQKNVGLNFTIKKISVEKFNELLKKIKANKNMCYKSEGGSNNAYTVTSRATHEKALIKLSGNELRLSGTRGDLYSELQLMMSQVSDYKTAIKSHIQSSGEEKRAIDVERQLKRKLPAAFEFLSEQSKIDLAIGIIDINNSAVVLSDYSTLLIPCFRGLERLIFDLQHAQGIVVKMIGQAYEKEDGNYVLKSGYRRKIPSVIYAEVMAALYTEYFKQRNFYAHSDGGYDNLSRIISDKQQVQSIFNHILEVINYNGQKLKEIGFRI